MSDNLPPLIAVLDEAEQILRELATLVMASTADFSTTWECANRVCDRYDIPSLA